MTRHDQEREELMRRLVLMGQVDATETALFQHRAAARYGLGITEMKALEILTREGATTAGTLAARLNLTSGAVTSLVDRLERRSVARRRPDATDRRRVLVEANLEALGDQGNVYEAIGQAFAELYMSYSMSQLRFLVEHLEASIEITRRETERLQSKE